MSSRFTSLIFVTLVVGSLGAPAPQALPAGASAVSTAIVSSASSSSIASSSTSSAVSSSLSSASSSSSSASSSSSLPSSISSSASSSGVLANASSTSTSLPPIYTGAINTTVLFNSTANFTHTETYANRTCKEFVANITASANNTIYTVTPPMNQQQMLAETYIASMATAPFNVSNSNGTRIVNGTWEIYMQYCEPTGGPTKPSVLQTIHGIVGTAGYWDATPEGDEGYSFVVAANNAGYGVLSYDRLGVGNSSKPDGIQIVQIGLEIQIAIEISTMLRNDTLGLNRTFSSVVGVGHSFGSDQLVGAAGVSPSAFDGLILTGFANNKTVSPLSSLLTFQNTIANTLPNTTAATTYDANWSELSNSYLITASQSADQLGFFSYPNYTQAALDLFTASKGTYTIGELLSMTNFMPPANYTGPVQVVTGARDAPFCATNCYDVPAALNITSKLDTAKDLFPSLNASNFETFVVPGTGHAVNFHPTAPEAYGKIIAFLTSHNL
ncbi:hypothetical protein P7C70_g2620, partial [Phenoliferia sp. Uapishka_3]